MIILKAQNQILTKNAKFTFLSENTLSGVTTLNLVNTSQIEVDDYVLIGDFGTETAEIRKVVTVPGSTSITVSATTFSHPETTKITRIPFNQVRFYHTTTATFSAGTPLGTEDLEADNFYTTYEDSTNGTGYGWFIFLNSTTHANSAPSNPIPYTDFDANSVKKILDAFLSSLNETETTKLSYQEMFRWLSEGYSILWTQLNLSNQEYTTPAYATLAFTVATPEVALPADFYKAISVSDSSGNDIGWCKQKNILYNNQNGSTDSPEVYLRGAYIGIVPATTTTLYLYYNAKPGVLSSIYSNVEVPGNNYYCLHDFLMYRASPKLNRSGKEWYLKAFQNSIDLMKISMVKQNANLDTWGIADQANV